MKKVIIIILVLSIELRKLSLLSIWRFRSRKYNQGGWLHYADRLELIVA